MVLKYYLPFEVIKARTNTAASQSTGRQPCVAHVRHSSIHAEQTHACNIAHWPLTSNCLRSFPKIRKAVAKVVGSLLSSVPTQSFNLTLNQDMRLSWGVISTTWMFFTREGDEGQLIMANLSERTADRRREGKVITTGDHSAHQVQSSSSIYPIISCLISLYSYNSFSLTLAHQLLFISFCQQSTPTVIIPH